MIRIISCIARLRCLDYPRTFDFIRLLSHRMSLILGHIRSQNRSPKSIPCHSRAQYPFRGFGFDTIPMYCAKKWTIHPLRTIRRSCLLFDTLVPTPLCSSLRVTGPTFSYERALVRVTVVCFRGGRFGREDATTSGSSTRDRVGRNRHSSVFQARRRLHSPILSFIRWWASP